MSSENLTDNSNENLNSSFYQASNTCVSPDSSIYSTPDSSVCSVDTSHVSSCSSLCSNIDDNLFHNSNHVNFNYFLNDKYVFSQYETDFAINNNKFDLWIENNKLSHDNFSKAQFIIHELSELFSDPEKIDCKTMSLLYVNLSNIMQEIYNMKELHNDPIDDKIRQDFTKTTDLFEHITTKIETDLTADKKMFALYYCNNALVNLVYFDMEQNINDYEYRGCLI